MRNGLIRVTLLPGQRDEGRSRADVSPASSAVSLLDRIPRYERGGTGSIPVLRAKIPITSRQEVYTNMASRDKNGYYREGRQRSIGKPAEPDAACCQHRVIQVGKMHGAWI